MKSVPLCYKESRARVLLFGGMTTVEFKLGEKTVAPLYVNAFGDVPGDAFMTHLQGDFFCLPFGITPGRPVPGYPGGAADGQPEYPHGYSANAAYEVVKQAEDTVTLRLVYDSHDIEAVERTVTLREDRIEFADRVFAKRPFRAPVGFHPIFRLPQQAQTCRLLPPACRAWYTYPVATDETSVFVPDANPAALSQVALKAGGTMDASCLPLPVNTEELLFAADVQEGKFELQYPGEGYAAVLTWDKEQIANCMLWMSNRGRQFAPWNGKNLCLGVEPVTSAFDFGRNISTRDNAMTRQGHTTCFAFETGETVFTHQIAVRPL